MSETDAIARIRQICLALPEATEKPFGEIKHRTPPPGPRSRPKAVAPSV